MPVCCVAIAVCLLLNAGGRAAWPAAAGSATAQACPAPASYDFSFSPQSGDSTAAQAMAVNRQPESTALTFFPHPTHTRYWISAQENTIYQMHGNFHSPYAGPNSFTAPFQYKASEVATLYLGYEIQSRPRYATEFFYDEENSGGRGLSQALGLAGFTNLDVVRDPSLGPTPYTARAEIHQTIGLTDAMIDQQRGPLALAIRVPARRIELRVGKFSLPDMLDLNPVLTDSHQQFTNWTVDNDGAWDYAADTRGYTYGADIEYQEQGWGVRYVLGLMPVKANGSTLDWALRRARGQNLEFELHRGVLPGRAGIVRLLIYGNNAHMGLYREAVNNYLEHVTPTPEIAYEEHFDALKYGVDFNVEQNVTANLRLAGRFGWNEGEHESFAYTEDDQTFILGADYTGTRWRRKLDKIGLAFVTNAIKKDHQKYLELGGLGFILGDGRLNYAREDILEAYYNAHLWRGLYGAIGNTFIAHPGYNQDRGPVDVEGLRVHLKF